MNTLEIPIEHRLLSDSFQKLLIEKQSLDNCKISKQLLELNKKPFIDDTSIRNITLRGNGLISYCPKGKEPTILNNKWQRNNRQECKIGKIVSALSLQISCNKEVENFIYFFKSKENLGNFKIVRGDDIPLWYNEITYEHNSLTGILANSCMRYDVCENYFQLYTQNSNVCKMLIYVNDKNLLLGRALLWKTDCNTKIMDRVYSNQAIELLFNEWAKKNNYIIKKETLNKKFTINTKSNKDIEHFPYMDSFKEIYKNEIRNFYSNTNDSDYIGLAEGTNGYLNDNDDDYAYCEISEERHHTDDMNYIEDYGWVCPRYSSYDDFDEQHILTDDAVEVYDNRTIDKDRVEYHNLIYVEESGMYAEQDQVTYCQYSEEYFITDLTEFLENDNGVIINAKYKNDAKEFFAA